MKIVVLVVFAFLTISCKEKGPSYDSQEDINKKITQNKPFFDFDEVIHYEFPIPTKEYEDLILVETLSEKGKFLSILLGDPCPETHEEKIRFKEAIESVDKVENNINPKYYNKLRNQIFSEKKCDDTWAYACVPIYRDIFIFKKNKKETGMAKICFECQLFSISNKDADTECFNMNGELDGLRKIIVENKKNK